MNSNPTPRRVITAVLAGALALAGAGAPAGAQEFRAFDGFLVDSANLVPGFSTGYLNLRLTGTTSEAALAGYAALARKEGEFALRNRLAAEDLGRYWVGSALGLPIAIVQETRDDGLRRLLIVVERNQSPREIFSASRSVDYPYVVLDLTLDGDGRGVGELHPLAKLEISPDGKLTYEGLAPLPMRILEVSGS
jgi:hypothetical protein